MLIDIGSEGSARELYDRLCRKEFDSVSLRKELKMGKYDADAVNVAALNYVDNCDDLFYESIYQSHHQPGETILGFESSHLAEAIELLLDYGLDPNKIFREDDPKEHAEEFNIMQWLQFIYNGYQAADALYLLLSHGGNPNLIVNGEPLVSDPDFDMCFDSVNREDIPDVIYDAKLHYWMVLVGFGAVFDNGRLPLEPVNGFDLSLLREHRNYYCGVIHSDRTKEGWDLCIFDKHTNWEVARL